MMEPVENGKYKCAKCGYVYDPEKGDPKHGIEPDTKFEDFPEAGNALAAGSLKKSSTRPE